MKLEQQVVSLDLAKRLKELGVKQESLFYWEPYEYPELSSKIVWELKQVNIDLITVAGICAFTVAELGEILKEATNKFDNNPSLPFWYWGGQRHYGWTFDKQKEDDVDNADTEANARAKMLIYLLENSLIDTKIGGK